MGCVQKHTVWKKRKSFDLGQGSGSRHASSGYAVDSGTRTRDPGNRCSFVRRPGQENSTARSATHQTAKNRVNDLPCVVKCGGQRPAEVGHLCVPPPPRRSLSAQTWTTEGFAGANTECNLANKGGAYCKHTAGRSMQTRYEGSHIMHVQYSTCGEDV